MSLDKLYSDLIEEVLTLNEGGAAGHLNHIYDNRELTFSDIKKILKAASSGKLERASEKMDGQALTFSYDVESGTMLAARSKTDISAGGMNAAGLAKKFEGRGSVEEAFNTAFKVLSGAVSALPEKTKVLVFGRNANYWYSMEVIYTKNLNVINYDSDNIVFHGWPIFKRSKDGSIEQVSYDVGVDTLTSNIDKMQAAVTATGWRVNGPAIVHFKKMTDGTYYNNAIEAIDEAMAAAGVSNNDTLEDYLESLCYEDAKQLRLSAKDTRSIVARCIEKDGAPSIVDIKKNLDKSEHGKVSEFIKNSPALLKRYIAPIELAINDFAVELLKGLQSSMLKNTDEEVMRLRAETAKAISAIENSGIEDAMVILRQQMSKLKSVENITTPVEGVVFRYKGNMLKFTGSFAQANALLGLFKYGRGKIKIHTTESKSVYTKTHVICNRNML